jgi:multidrug transporter EmrE-like cation transporter
MSINKIKISLNRRVLGGIHGVNQDVNQAICLFSILYLIAMSFITVFAMTAAELVGNTHLKWYTENGSGHHLGVGILAWAFVILFLVQAFRSETMMWTCIMWEAMIVIGGALTAYFVFGEKFNHWIQWLGILMALGAAMCINYK